MTRWLWALWRVAVAVPAAGAWGGAPPAPRASVGTQGMQLKPITAGPHAGKQRAEQHFTFTLGQSRYRIRYGVRVDPAQPERAFPSEGYLGMPSPTTCNWYHGGFLSVRINGRDIGGTKLHAGYVAWTRSRATADLVWDVAPARVRVRFVGLGGDDKLLCEIALEPKQEIQDLRVALRCYPSFFTAWHKRDGDRKITTPAATLDQGQKVELPAADHWFAVYYDTVFDVARGEGAGPCAALLAPEAVRTVKFHVGSYAVGTELVCRPDARTVRLAFWDLPKTTNKAALASFRRHGARWLDELRRLDFTPAAVRGFDPKAELAQLDRLTRAPEVRRELGKRADAYRTRIQALAASEGTPGILAQAELLQCLAAYRDFLWELKVAALLAD